MFWKILFFADFEIVHPTLSDISGNTVSHFHLHGNRVKRDSSSRTDTLYLNITGHGQTFEIHLVENRNLLAPGFKVYHRKKSGGSGEQVETVETPSDSFPTTNCHFSGKVHSHEGRAALSLCDGLVSIMIKLSDSMIYLLCKYTCKGQGKGFKSQDCINYP